ncbi:MAG: FHA domain-containing protein [Chloroflexi bacterium]|nr:FHA domain-containing protein [Chloroflexota bacterium]
MITCKDCGASQPEGTLFCDECGCYVLKTAALSTVILPFSDFAYSAPPPPVSNFLPEPLVEPKKVTFIIPGSRRRLEMTLVNQIRVGRADDQSTASPELNLAEDSGAALGVSRIHAVIQNGVQGLVVTDMGSTNGTLLNNSPLSPEIPYPLKSGDEMRFGDLLVHILF